jgi:hypothetical protein
MKEKAKQFIWISFDLGVQGDYEGLYSWLDAHDAKECGDNVAALEYEYRGDPVDSLRKDLRGALEINAKTRIYVILRAAEKPYGRFIFGNRKRPPWTGFAVQQGEDVDYGT